MPSSCHNKVRASPQFVTCAAALDPFGLVAYGWVSMKIALALLVISVVLLAQPMYASDDLSVILSPAQRIDAIRYLLGSEDRATLNAFGNTDDALAWIDHYWVQQDIIHTDDTNVMRIEHYRRVSVALERFAVMKAPGWDQRGEIYIRYGEPLLRGISPPEALGPEAAQGFEVLPEMVTVGYTRAREMWFYGRFNMFVQFEDVGEDGYYTYFSEHVRGFERERDRLHAAEMDLTAHTLEGLPYTPWATPLERQVGNFLEALATHAWWTPYMDRASTIPVYCDLVSFVGQRGRELSVELEFDRDAGDGGGLLAGEFEATVAFRDNGRNVISRSKQRVHANERRSTHGTLIPMRFSLGDASRVAEVDVTIQNMATTDFTSEAYAVGGEAGGVLVVSDLLFAYDIEAAGADATFARRDLDVIPHPARVYSRGHRVPIYFEIYHLDVDDTGMSAYTITYEIVREDGNAAIELASTFSSAAHGPNDVVQMHMQSENLQKGRYRCRVVITDNHSNRSVERDAVFVIE